MSKSTNILDGCTIMDIALSESDYNYYGYVRTGTSGEWVILRENIAGTEYRYAVGSSEYTSAFADRANQNFTIRTNL